MAVPSELVFISKRKGQEVRIHQSDRPDDEICSFWTQPGADGEAGRRYRQQNFATPARLTSSMPLVPENTAQMRENLDDS